MLMRGRIFALLMLSATVAQAQLQMMPFDGRGKPWIAPDRRFAIEIPPAWNVFIDEKDPSTVELRPADGTGEASLFVRRVKVPVGASAKQLRLNALEQRLRKLPSFRELARRDAKIGPFIAAAVLGTYYFQGNAQFPRALEEVFIVQGEVAYVFHFECFEPLAPSFAADLDRVYKSFLPDPPARLGSIEAPNPYEQKLLIDTDRVNY
jgi:hypothetical protein